MPPSSRLWTKSAMEAATAAAVDRPFQIILSLFISTEANVVRNYRRSRSVVEYVRTWNVCEPANSGRILSACGGGYNSVAEYGHVVEQPHKAANGFCWSHNCSPNCHSEHRPDLRNSHTGSPLYRVRLTVTANWRNMIQKHWLSAITRSTPQHAEANTTLVSQGCKGWSNTKTKGLRDGCECSTTSGGSRILIRGGG